MTKEEILRSYTGWKPDSVKFSLALDAMQVYADQQTAELRAEVERLKEEIEEYKKPDVCPKCGEGKVYKCENRHGFCD